MRRHSSVLNFHGPGSVKPSWESPSVPLLPAAPQRSASPWRDNVNHLLSDITPIVSMALGWSAARLSMRSGRACDPETGAIVAFSSTPKPPFPGPTDQDLCCSVEWKGWQEKNAHFAPSEVALLAVLDLGSTAWTDSASLQRPAFLAHKQAIPGRVALGPRASSPPVGRRPGCGYQRGKGDSMVGSGDSPEDQAHQPYYRHQVHRREGAGRHSVCDQLRRCGADTPAQRARTTRHRAGTSATLVTVPRAQRQRA